MRRAVEGNEVLRATLAQQRYAIRNPRRFKGYGEFCWGITASEGPGPATKVIDGVRRRFFDYVARAIPYGPDDGTLAPWAVVASLPFAPEIVLPTIRSIDEMGIGKNGPYGFEATFNPTFPSETGDPRGWELRRRACLAAASRFDWGAYAREMAQIYTRTAQPAMLGTSSDNALNQFRHLMAGLIEAEQPRRLSAAE